MIRRFLIRIYSFPRRFVESDPGAADFRLLILFITLALILGWNGFRFERPLIEAAVESWKQNNLYVILLTQILRVPDFPFEVVALFTNWKMVRFLWVALVPVILGLMAASRYLQDIFELEKFALAWQYITASLFGANYPRLTIENGRKETKVGEQNLLDVIGGPGYVTIRSGNIVLFENLRGPSSVRAQGRYFVLSGETIKEIASLEDQHGEIEVVKDVSKDGIEIHVHKVRYRYRLRTGRQPADYAERTKQEPFPFSVEAMRDMAYNRNVVMINPDTKILQPWNVAVRLAVDSAISGYIAKNFVDHLTAPKASEKDPRAEIANALDARSVRQRLRSIGAELLWVDIGEFTVPRVRDDLDQDPRVSTWAATWAGKAEVTRAYGKAQEKMYQELGRAEAQAELLMAIMEALDEANIEGTSEEHLSRLILVRTARIIEAMADKDRRKLPPTSSANRRA